MEINVNNNLDKFLSRDDTKAIKGIAIILMLSHHLRGFPDRIRWAGTLVWYNDIWRTNAPILWSIC